MAKEQLENKIVLEALVKIPAEEWKVTSPKRIKVHRALVVVDERPFIAETCLGPFENVINNSRLGLTNINDEYVWKLNNFDARCSEHYELYKEVFRKSY